MGYPIEGVVEEGAGAAEAEKPIEFYLASADPAKGEQVFKKCAACHNADKGGANALGPNLWGVLGEPIGKGAGLPLLRRAGGRRRQLGLGQSQRWLTSPKKFAPGTKMTFAGLSNPEDRANVIAFLNAHSDAPLPLPAAPAEAAARRGRQGGDAATPRHRRRATFRQKADEGAGAQQHRRRQRRATARPRPRNSRTQPPYSGGAVWMCGGSGCRS